MRAIGGVFATAKIVTIVSKAKRPFSLGLPQLISP